MSTYATQAIVFKRTNYGEADRLVTLLTEKYGRVTAIARGVRKPLSKLRGFLELLTYGDCRLVEGKTFDTVVEVTPIDYFKQIRADIEQQTLAYGLAEMVLVTLADREPHAGLLDWVVQWLKAIDVNVIAKSCGVHISNSQSQIPNNFQISNLQFPKQLFYAAIIIQYLSFIGQAPNLGECGICRKTVEPQSLAWSHENGGFIHWACGQSIHDIRPIKVDVGKLLRFICKAKPERISKLMVNTSTVERTVQLTYDFFRYQVGKELRLIRPIVN